MILYTNGDEVTAAAQLVNEYSYASDDFTKVALGKKPHPDNLNASWSMHLSKLLKLSLVCEAEAYCSNERILRTTYDFVRNKLPALDSKLTYIVIGWTAWDREEVFDQVNNEYVSITNTEPRYRNNKRTPYWEERNKFWANEIWELHHYLNNLEIPHLFFNSLHRLEPEIVDIKDWYNGYVDPYNLTYQKFTQVNHPYSINDKAQRDWAQFLFSVLTKQSYSSNMSL